MSIGTAVQRGHLVYVYDERNNLLFTRAAGYRPREGLAGYTSNTLNIRRGHLVYTYDSKGRQIGVVPASYDT